MSSTENLSEKKRLSGRIRRKKSNIPEFLLKRGKNNSEEGLEKFKSQKLLKPKIHFTYKSPVKANDSFKRKESFKPVHRHTKSVSTKEIMIFPY